ncbi:MAG: exo-alpha-sialidase [Omnitrophica WOR_2 bacterium]
MTWKNRWLKNTIHSLSIALIILMFLASAVPGRAQSTTEAWTPPINLSQSGSTSNPMLVIDSNAVAHVVWEDKFAGFMHSEQDGNQWTPPAPLPSPWVQGGDPNKPQVFSMDSPIPLLVADLKGKIYAFWIDALNQLWFSRVAANDFGGKTSWESPRMLSDSALKLAVTVDATNQLHLVYIYQKQADNKQPGVYYSKLPDSSNTWSKEVLLSGSAYFRGMTKDQANLNITTGAVDNLTTVYVTWDNRPLNRVFLERSTDGGQNWDQAKEIDGPESNSGGMIPYSINISAVGSNAVIIWQIGQPGISCKQYFQGSTNNGDTWSTRQAMLSGISGCSQMNQFFTDTLSHIFLASTINAQVYLQIWNGKSWSEPQLQADLYGFINPETFDTVNLHDHQFAFSKDNQLISVGSDVTDQGDIWFASLAINSTNSWFQPKSEWSSAKKVTDKTASVIDLQVITEGDHIVHALWIQPNPDNLQTPAIFYARWDGINWTTPSMVQQQADGNIYHISTTLSKEGRLLLTWNGGPSGQVYFSWADASKAINTTEWAAPKQLPSPQPAGSSPEILTGSSGTIYVTYAIPLNEGRGIYLVSSENDGQTWSSPVKVFDAVAAGWNHVDRPDIYQGPDGRLGITWSQMTLLGQDPVGLYAAFSADQGKTWSSPQKITGTSTVWSKIIPGSGNTVNLAWLEKSKDLYSLHFIQSTDGGSTWSKPVIVLNSVYSLEPVVMLPDMAGDLHILLITQEKDLSLALEHWEWDQESWSAKDGLRLGEGMSTDATNLAAAMTPAGHIYALFTTQTQDLTSNKSSSLIQFSDLMLHLPAVKLKPVPAITQVVPSDSQPTLQPSPTITPAPTRVLLDTGSENTGLLANSWGGLAAGALLSGLVIVFGFVISRYNRKNR